MIGTQTILLFVIASLTVLLLVLGIQIFFILRDFRKTIFKANKVLDDVSIISDAVSKPVSFLSNPLVVSIIASIAAVFKGNNAFSKITKENKKNFESSAYKKNFESSAYKKNFESYAYKKKPNSKKERVLEIKAGEEYDEEKTDRPVRRFFRGVPRTFYRS